MVWCKTKSEEDIDLYMGGGEVPVLPDDKTFAGGPFDCDTPECYPQCFSADISEAWTKCVVVLGFQATDDLNIECNTDAPILDKDDADDIDLRSWENVDLEEEKYYAGLFKFDVGRQGRFARCEMRCGNCCAQVFMRRNAPPLGPDDASNNCSINRPGVQCEINYPSGAPGDEEIFVAIYNQGELENLDNTFGTRCEADWTEDNAQRIRLEDEESVNLYQDGQALFFLDLNECDYDDTAIFAVRFQVSGALDIRMRVDSLPTRNPPHCTGGCIIYSSRFLPDSGFVYALVSGGDGEVVCSSISQNWENNCELVQNGNIFRFEQQIERVNYFDDCVGRPLCFFVPNDDFLMMILTIAVFKIAATIRQTCGFCPLLIV